MKDIMNYVNIADEIIKIGKLIYDKGYNAARDGNISVRIDEGKILITVSGAHLGFLKYEDLVPIDYDGNILSENNHKPSSEVLLHTGIYRERKDVNAVIHAHAPFCISLSLLNVDTMKNTYVVASGPIPITEIALPSTGESYKRIKPFIKNRSKAILRRHGAVTWAKDLMTAFVKLEEMEHFAKCFVNANAVQEIKPVSEEIQNKLFKLWNIK